MDYNKIIIAGRVGRNPEIKTFENGSVTNISLATAEKYKDKESVQWHNIEFWGKLAEIVSKHVVKGQQLLVEGKLKYKQYTDKEGNKRWLTKISASEVRLGQKPGGAKAETKSEPEQNENQNNGSDDLPF